MAKKKKDVSEESRGLIGSNIGDLNTWIKDASERMKQLKGERTAINEEMGAIRAEGETKGVNRKAFDKALNDVTLDKEAREAFDESYAICREAMGFPIGHQFDAFTEPAKQAAAH